MRKLVGRMVWTGGRQIIRLVTRPAVSRIVSELSIDVTRRAIRSGMRSRQWKWGIVVIECGGLPTICRVALRTLMGQLVGCMVRVCGRLVCGLVTIPALRRCPRELPINVTQRAAHGNVRACERERGEIVIVCCGCPGGSRMTLLTRVGKIASLVIRIRGRLIIALMTRPAIRRRIVEMPVRVTLPTGRANMCPGQRKLCLSMIKRRRLPGNGRVALQAGMAEVVGNVIGITDTCVSLFMAGVTLGGGSLELPVDVTRGAIGTNVCSSQWKSGGIVAERGRRPLVRRMTLLARVGELILRMIWILRAIVIGLVTRKTFRGRIVILPIHVALSATRGNVRSGQREIRRGMVETCRLPRHRRVTGGAFVTVISCHVVRILGALIIRLMACVTLLRSARVLAIRVTRGAVYIDVGPGQRERRQIVIKLRRCPSGGRVTLLARMRQLQLDVIWVIRAIIVCLMAGPTVLRRAVELPIYVALRATDIDVSPGKREIGQVVIEGSGLPRRRRVALCAIMIVVSSDVIWIGDALVIALVTRPAVRRQVLILSVHVAGQAVHIHMGASERESRIVMVEGRRSPAVCRVTLQAFVWKLILRMIRFVRILIIGLMTRPTVCRRAGVLAIDMALGAPQTYMRSGQGKV